MIWLYLLAISLLSGAIGYLLGRRTASDHAYALGYADASDDYNVEPDEPVRYRLTDAGRAALGKVASLPRSTVAPDGSAWRFASAGPAGSFQAVPVDTRIRFDNSPLTRRKAKAGQC